MASENPAIGGTDRFHEGSGWGERSKLPSLIPIVPFLAIPTPSSAQFLYIVCICAANIAVCSTVGTYTALLRRRRRRRPAYSAYMGSPAHPRCHAHQPPSISHQSATNSMYVLNKSPRLSAQIPSSLIPRRVRVFPVARFSHCNPASSYFGHSFMCKTFPDRELCIFRSYMQSDRASPATGHMLAYGKQQFQRSVSGPSATTHRLQLPTGSALEYLGKNHILVIELSYLSTYHIRTLGAIASYALHQIQNPAMIMRLSVFDDVLESKIIPIPPRNPNK